MTHFEFVSVAISIILALGIGRLLDGIGPALHARHRYWVHVGWIVQKFFNHVFWWWGVWLARDLDWNLLLFLYFLCGPVVLYLQAAGLVKRSQVEPDSWRRRFYEVRAWFFAGNLVLIGNLSITRTISESLAPAPVPALLLLGILSLLGLVSRDSRLHAALIAIALPLQLLGFGVAVFELRPG